MSESSTNFWKYMALFLLLVLIGIYFLYDWYDGKLDARLTEKDAQIVQATGQVNDLGARLHQTEEARNRFEDENAALTVQVSGLQSDLAAEQQKTSQLSTERDHLIAAHAELDRLYEADKVKTVTLQMDLDKMKQAITDTVAEHQAKIAALERHLNERVELAKTTPMDASLVRAAVAVGVLSPDTAEAAAPPASDAETVQTLTTQLADAAQQLQQRQDELTQRQTDLDAANARLAGMERQIAELSQQNGQNEAETVQTLTDQLAEAQSQLANLQSDRDALQSQLADAAQQLQQRQDELTQRQTDLDAANARLAGMERQIAELSQQTGQNENARTAEIAALHEQLASEQQRCAGLQQQHQSALDALTQTLDETRRKLAETERQLHLTQAATDDTSPQQALAAANARVASLEVSLDEERRQAARDQQSIQDEATQTLARLKAREASYAELGGAYTSQGMRLRLTEADLRFQPGQATLPSGELTSLDRIAALLREQPDLKARIAGHTDSLGGAELNLKLSQQRADAVKQGLIERGIDAGRITAEGIGVTQPIADNATADGRRHNRRIEVYLSE